MDNNELLALLEKPWELKDGKGSGIIVGAWAEDGNPFEIQCPIQLAPFLVKLQNKLYQKNEERKTYQKKLTQINNDFFSILG